MNSAYGISLPLLKICGAPHGPKLLGTKGLATELFLLTPAPVIGADGFVPTVPVDEVLITELGG